MQFQHIVVLMLENHSFDRTLGYLSTIGRPVDGIDANKLRSNDGVGGPYTQAVTETRNVMKDPQHDLKNVLSQISDGCAHFVKDYQTAYPDSGEAKPAEIMGYYPRGFLPALHQLAEEFIVCDRWFSSMPGPTWPNRFFVHSGTSLGHVDMPEGVFTPGIHCYNQQTIYDELDKTGVTWRIYAGDFPQSLLLTHQWNKVGNYRDLNRFEADVASGDLPAYCFIEPRYFMNGQNDQHPPHDVLRGDVLIAQVYNSLLANPALFAETLLIVVHDEHGGFYDHVVPPEAVPPDGHKDVFAFGQYGVRVPAVLVSPRLGKGEQSTDLDHTSILRLAIDNFGLSTTTELGQRVANAQSPLNGIQCLEQPRQGVPRAAVAAVQEPLPQKKLSSTQMSLVSFSHYLESKIASPAIRESLQADSYSVFDGPQEQAALAMKRLKAFMADRLHPQPLPPHIVPDNQQP